MACLVSGFLIDKHDKLHLKYALSPNISHIGGVLQVYIGDVLQVYIGGVLQVYIGGVLQVYIGDVLHECTLGVTGVLE